MDRFEVPDNQYRFLPNAIDEEKHWQMELKRMREDEEYNDMCPYGRKQVIKRLKQLQGQIAYLKLRSGFGNEVFTARQRNILTEEFSQWTEWAGNGIVRTSYT